MTKPSPKWIVVAGARPNFMKVAPLIRAIHVHNALKVSLSRKNYMNQTKQISLSFDGD